MSPVDSVLRFIKAFNGFIWSCLNKKSKMKYQNHILKIKKKSTVCMLQTTIIFDIYFVVLHFDI